MTDTPRRSDTTIRMKRCPDRTLDGYVFENDDHARRWLASYRATQEQVTLERVVVGPLVECRFCGGTGYRQKTEKVCDLTLEELFAHA